MDILTFALSRLRRIPSLWVLLSIGVGILLVYYGFCISPWWSVIFVGIGAVGLLFSLFLSPAKAFRFSWTFNLFGAVCLLGGGIFLGQRRLVSIEGGVKNWTVSSTVVDFVITSNPIRRNQKIRVEAQILSNPEEWQGKTVFVYLDSADVALEVGDAFSIEHALLVPSLSSSKSSYTNYLYSRSVSGILYCSQVGTSDRISGKISKKGLQNISVVATDIRKRLIQQLYNIGGIRGREITLLSAMCLGDKTNLQGMEESFRSIGISHLLSVSGFHVGVIFLFFSWLLQPLFSRFSYGRVILAVCLFCLVWIFAFVSGFSIPTQRAALMLSLVIFGKTCRQPISSTNILFFTALVLIIGNPFILFDIGFQLTFVGVLSILLFMPLFSVSMTNPIIRFLWTTISVCLSCQILLLPLALFHFGSVSIFFLWGNFVLGILSVVIIPVTFVFLFLSFLGAYSFILGKVVHLGASFFLQLLDFFALHYGSQVFFRPNIWILMGYYLSIGIVYLFVKRHMENRFLY